jgi:hypothetical protein
VYFQSWKRNDMKKILIIVAAVSALACAPALARGNGGEHGDGGGFRGGAQIGGFHGGGHIGGRGVGVGIGLGAAGIGLGLGADAYCPRRVVGYDGYGEPIYRRVCGEDY